MRSDPCAPPPWGVTRAPAPLCLRHVARNLRHVARDRTLNASPAGWIARCARATHCASKLSRRLALSTVSSWLEPTQMVGMVMLASARATRLRYSSHTARSGLGLAQVARLFCMTAPCKRHAVNDATRSLRA